jgi:hypothetical protein
MAQYWLAGYALANAVILFDFVLELMGWTTISEWVWGHTPKSKRWVWYVGAFAAFNVLFWTVGGPVATAFLGGWLIAHLQGAK